MFSTRQAVLAVIACVAVGIAAGCGSTASRSGPPTTAAHVQSSQPTPDGAALHREAIEREYAADLKSCIVGGDPSSECKEHIRNCIVLHEKPASCRENYVGRTQEVLNEKKHAEERKEAELEQTQHEVETLKENERHQRLVREQEERAARVCHTSPDKCERAERESEYQIKKIGEE
jgi:hypothetical protein